MTQLNGRVAIVTGASRGLGKEIALSLGRNGARVLACARTAIDGGSPMPGSLDHTVQLIRRAGGVAEPCLCDVTREEDIARATQAALDRFGRIDILVNNAGTLMPGTLEELQPRHWSLIFRINVDAAFHLSRAVVPHMRAAGGGHIINISSRAAIGPGAGPYAQRQADGSESWRDRAAIEGGVAYGASKAALERFSQGLAAELYGDRISVNVLSPDLPLLSEGAEFYRRYIGDTDFSQWRPSARIMGDAVVVVCNQEPGAYTGNILYDEQVMRREGGMGDAVMAAYPVGAS